MPDKSFDSFMQQRRRVASAFVNGDPGPLREISASADPATFFGPSGGAELGAAHVLEVNAAGSHRFHGGTTELEILHSGSSGDLAYWTGFQRASVQLERRKDPVPTRLRVTELFRFENGAWKLIHRHADTLTELQVRH
jgi:ketosteroid isomerase-like protein